MTGLPQRLAERLPPEWFGYRWIRHETVADYFARQTPPEVGAWYHTVHLASRADNPLPQNIHALEQLPDDRGWWGFSFRDVPSRVSGETFVACLPNCLVTWYRDPERANDFYPAIVTGRGRALEMRELQFRHRHGEVLRRAGPPAHLDSAAWIVERVYHNHSHWLTAHLPKLLLLRARGALDRVLFPEERTAAMDESLRLLGIDPARLRTFDPGRPLQVDHLTVIGSDRFRPELLQLVARAYCAASAPAPSRRVFITRCQAARRRLLNEDEIWPLFEAAGFERVCFEELTFGAQVALMRETAVLAGPHGAGLANMIFCSPGTHVVEIADLGFPNPNFYAMAAALGHPFWLLPAGAVGEGRPIDRDLMVDAAVVRDTLRELGS